VGIEQGRGRDVSVGDTGDDQAGGVDQHGRERLEDRPGAGILGRLLTAEEQVQDPAYGLGVGEQHAAMRGEAHLQHAS